MKSFRTSVLESEWLGPKGRGVVWVIQIAPEYDQLGCLTRKINGRANRVDDKARA